MSGNSQPAVPTAPSLDTSSLGNFVSKGTGGAISSDIGKDAVTMGNIAAPVWGGGIASMANGIYGAIMNPPKANLQNPATAGAPPTQAQTTADSLAGTVAGEKATAAQNPWAVFGGQSGLDDQPMTSSLKLMGS